MDLRKLASIAAIALGALMIVGGIATWTTVSATLAEQRIVIPDDGCLAGRTVRGPLTAYCQADVIQAHTVDATGGMTYAELDREDPLREVAMNSAFLQASLFTSIVAFGVAAMAAAIGLLFVLIGLGMRDVRQQVAELSAAPRPAGQRAAG